MTMHAATQASYFPRWWRMAMIASSVLILCSCRGPVPQRPAMQDAAPYDATLLPPPAESGHMMPMPPASHPSAMLPPQVAQTSYEMPIGPGHPGAYVGGPACVACGPGGYPHAAGTPWYTGGAPGKFAQDEYLCDGGDHGIPANVQGDWEVHGLDVEDTIAHYDTLDGRVEVAPSNRVCVYAPKFNSVRRVSGADIFGVRNAVADIRFENGTRPLAETNGPRRLLLPEQTVREVGRTRATNAQLDQPALIAQTEARVRMLRNGFEAYEDFQIIRRGVMEMSEGPMLANSIENALIWQHDLPPVVLFGTQTAAVELALQRAQRVYMVDRPDGPEEMRLVKVASTRTAKSGDIVEFTLRYDNTGLEPIGNVTIIDKLTTRLEYVPDSAQNSKQGQLFVEPNEANSVTLRWEITEPLEPGDGGIIRFQTRVR